MPRFFFDVHDGENIDDETGVELPDIDAARQHAIQFAGELIIEIGRQFWDGSDWKMVVSDARRLTLFELHFYGTDGAAALGR